MNELDERVKREKQWHDARFTSDDRDQKTGRFYKALADWFADYTQLATNNPNNIKALELGAGLESIGLSESFGFSLYSIDISDRAIAHLKNLDLKNPVKFEWMDAHDLNFDDEAFDIVIGRGVLHHLELSVAINEVKRVLKPDGKIVFGEPLAGNILINLYRRFTPHLRSPDEKPLDHSELIQIRKSFEGAEIVYYGFLTLIPAIFGLKVGRTAFRWADDILLNKLGLGRYLAWACIIHN